MAQEQGRGVKPKQLTEWELIERQRRIDEGWEQNLREWREREREIGRLCHRGPGDPDWE
jgi:hypothetical protein